MELLPAHSQRQWMVKKSFVSASESRVPLILERRMSMVT